MYKIIFFTTPFIQVETRAKWLYKNELQSNLHLYCLQAVHLGIGFLDLTLINVTILAIGTVTKSIKPNLHAALLTGFLNSAKLLLYEETWSIFNLQNCLSQFMLFTSWQHHIVTQGKITCAVSFLLQILSCACQKILSQPSYSWKICSDIDSDLNVMILRGSHLISKSQRFEYRFVSFLLFAKCWMHRNFWNFFC